jgi:hypothetical protein
MAMAETGDIAPGKQARLILRTALTGSLATVNADGSPHVSFVNFATRPDAAPIFLFSTLSAHTRNLQRDPRLAFMVGEPPKTAGDPLDTARVSVIGRAEPSTAAEDRARFLRRHPAAEAYAGFGDFAIYRATVADVHFVGGFARARSLAPEKLLLDASESAPLAAAEADIVAHMNEDHAEAIALYATRLLGEAPGPWTMTGIDAEGADLRVENRTARLEFARTIANAEEARKELIGLAQKARKTS